MYRLDDQTGLTHDVMGPVPVRDPRFCQGGASLVSTADDYLRFARMLLGGGEVDVNGDASAVTQGGGGGGHAFLPSSVSAMTVMA